MSGSVNQVELIHLPVSRLVHHANGMSLDGDSALALQVHIVEHLLLHLAHAQRSGDLQHSIGERAFAVVDVGNNCEISYESAVH